MGLIIAIHITICVFMVVVILLQPGKSDSGIGFGSSSQSIFGSRGAGNFLTKTTSVCATIFLVTSFLMSFPKCTGKVEEDVGGPEPFASATPAASPSAATPAPSAAAPSPAPAKPAKSEGEKAKKK